MDIIPNRGDRISIYGQSNTSNPGPVGRKCYIGITPQLMVIYDAPVPTIWARFIAWIGSCFGPRIPTPQISNIITLNHIPKGVAEINSLAVDLISPNCLGARQRLIRPQFRTEGSLIIRDSHGIVIETINDPLATTERSQEIEAFYTQCLKDPIYSSLKQQDLAFLKTYLIPNLLATKDALIGLRNTNPTTTFISKEQPGEDLLMNFQSLVENAVTAKVINKESYFYEIANISTDSKNTLRGSEHGIGSRTPMSVKIYPDGKIKFVIPYDRSSGSYKKGSHIIHSNVTSPNVFTPLVKLSGHRDDNLYLQITQNDIISEYKTAKILGVDQELFPYITIGERNQLFSQPLTPLSDMIIPTASGETLPGKQTLEKAQIIQKVDQLFEVIIELLKKIYIMHQKGLVHADINPNNILVKTTTNDDGTTHLVPFFTDFGMTTKIDQPSKQYHAAGYSLPKIQGAAREAIARLWSRYGFEERYIIVETKI
jgi:serine/threonine protein kinase